MSHENHTDTGDEPARETTLHLHSRYRRSPFFDATQRYGCEAYDIYNHMLLPGSYGRDAVEDYWHLL